MTVELFVPPTWIEGLVIQSLYMVLLPLVIAIVGGIVVWRLSKDGEIGLFGFGVILTIGIFIMVPIGSVIWHNTYEIPSVQEKVITVKEWQPKPGLHPNSDGLMVINSANDLLLITTENEGFLNEENLYFQKFNTRDIFNQLKVNGTYKIKYFGWRNGFNSGFPTILSVEQVINENNTIENEYSKYFGTKLA